MSNASQTTTQNVSPSFDLVSANSAVVAAVLPIDVPRAVLSFDPKIGEQGFLECKPVLLAMPVEQVGPPNVDPLHGAMAAMALADHVEGELCAGQFGLVHESFLGDATPPFLRKLAQATFYIETRARTRAATANEVKIDAALLSEGVTVRDRMLRVLAYNFDTDAIMQAEVADIRSGNGYMDLAADLARLATHYTQHAEALAIDKQQYRPEDQVRARGISQEIVSALHTASTDTIVDLRNRAWSKLARVYARIKAAGDFVFADHPAALAGFVPLRQAVVAQTSRRSRTSTDPANPETPVVPASPIAVPGASPIAAPPEQAPGTGPGGSPLL